MLGVEIHGRSDFELEAGLAAIEVRRQVQREHEGQQRDDQREKRMSRSRRGKNSSSIRPPAGANVTSVRMEVSKASSSSQPHPDHVGDHRGGPDGDPSGIGAQVAGLHVPHCVGDIARAVGAAVERWRQSRRWSTPCQRTLRGASISGFTNSAA